MVAGSIASEKLMAMLWLIGIWIAPSAGRVVATVGGVLSIDPVMLTKVGGIFAGAVTGKLMDADLAPVTAAAAASGNVRPKVHVPAGGRVAPEQVSATTVKSAALAPVSAAGPSVAGLTASGLVIVTVVGLATTSALCAGKATAAGVAGRPISWPTRSFKPVVVAVFPAGSVMVKLFALPGAAPVKAIAAAPRPRKPGTGGGGADLRNVLILA